jgi:hypothetical protein
MKIIKSNGPKIEPWGTPDFKISLFDSEPLNLTIDFRSERYDHDRHRPVPTLSNTAPFASLGVFKRT